MTSLELSLALQGRVTWLDRYRPLLSDAQLALFMIGATFWVGSIHDPGMFKLTTWGALAYAVPAEVWAGLNMVCSAMIWVGLIRPIRRRLVLIGSTVNVAQYAVLAVSAVGFGGEQAVGIYAAFVFLPLFARMTWEAARDARSAHR